MSISRRIHERRQQADWDAMGEASRNLMAHAREVMDRPSRPMTRTERAVAIRIMKEGAPRYYRALMAVIGDALGGIIWGSVKHQRTRNP